MKKTLSLVLTAALSLSLLSACTPAADPQPSSGGAEPSAPTVSTRNLFPLMTKITP